MTLPPLTALVALVTLGTALPAADVRLFILSGQSNMANLKPEQTFTPALKKAFPDDDLVVVKEAINGQQIRMWLKDWKPPADLPVRADAKPVRTDGNGRIYTTLMTSIGTALTGKARPVSVTFVWLQGEADARAGYGAVYEAGLRELYRNLQTDLKRTDIDWVIGRISDYGNTLPDEEPDWNRIRGIQVAVATSTPRTTWVDNDDLNGAKDGLHYPPKGYQQLGERFAQAAITLIRTPASTPATNE